MITVIVPIYNVEAFLPRCIESILAQTYGDFELILVDDGSPDNCGAICDAYAQKDNRIRVIHQKNCGLSAARNAGLDAAQGEYIAFCDSDDYMNGAFIEKLYCQMIRSGADLVSSSYTRIDADGNIVLQNPFMQMEKTLDSEEVMLDHLVNDILLHRIGCEVWTRLFKAEIIRRYHLRFCETCGSYAEDLGFVLAYTLHCRKITTVECADYNYVLRNGSIMRTNYGKIRLDSMNEISKYIAKEVNAMQGKPLLKAGIPILHYYVMDKQYAVSKRQDNYRSLPEQIAKIQDVQWYYRQTSALRKCRRLFCKIAGAKFVSLTVALSHYCCHGSWMLYRLELHVISLVYRIKAIFAGYKKKQ